MDLEIEQQQSKAEDRVASDLCLSVLCRIVKWGPSPVVLHDVRANLKQLLQDAILPPAGSKVQGSGSISVLTGQADISARRLVRGS